MSEKTREAHAEFVRRLVGIIIRHWRAGLRDADEIHTAVFGELCHSVGSAVYNEAADEAWRQIQAGAGG
jgi:hypothetical protein